MGQKDGRIVDFAMVLYIEDFRDYFDAALDLGELEKYRSLIDQANDLETLRALFEKEGPVLLPGCSVSMDHQGQMNARIVR